MIRTIPKLNIFASGILVLSIATFLFNVSPCVITSGQISCDADDNIGFSNPVIANELHVENPSTIGNTDEYLISSGSGSVPIWDNTQEDFWTLVDKEVDETIVTDSVLNYDSDLSFTINANEHYIVEGFIVVDLESSIRLRFRLCGDGSGYVSIREPNGTNDWTIGDHSTNFDVGFSSFTYGIKIHANCLKNGSTGTTGLSWAQNLSHADDVTLKSGSWLKYRVVG